MGNTTSQEIPNGGRPLASFYDHRNQTSTIVTRSTFQTYNEKTRQLLSVVPSKHNISVVVYHQDYDIFVTGEDDFCIRVYRSTTGELINTLPSKQQIEQGQQQQISNLSHKEVIKTLLFIDDHNSVEDNEPLLMLSGSTDGTIRLWNVENGEMMAVYVVANNPTGAVIDDQVVSGVVSLAFDHRHQVIVAGCADGIIRTFSLIDRIMLGQLEGHARGAILNVAITNDGLLLSSSMDQSIRLWSLETSTTIAGSLFFAQTLCYDSYRDVFFAGSDEGTVAVVKIESSTDQQSKKYSLKKLSLLDFKKPAILHLHYNSLVDSILITSIDNTIGFLPNVTGIPFDEKDLKAKRLNHHHHHQFGQSNNNNNNNNNNNSSQLNQSILLKKKEEEEDELSTTLIQLNKDIIELAIQEMRVVEKSGKASSMNDAPQHLLIDRIKKISGLSFELFDDKDDISKLRRNKFVQGLLQFEKQVVELAEEYQTSLKELVTSRAGLAALHPETSKDTKELTIACKRQEIIERHKKELEEFDRLAENEMNSYDSRIPLLANRAVHLLLNNQESVRRSRVDLEIALASHLATSFPVVSGDEASRYHLGSLISNHATNVFLGIDVVDPMLVAIKMLPAGVPIAPPPSHPNLTKVIGQVKGPQTLSVVMENCSGGDVKQFVEEFDQHTLPIPLVRTIVHQILQCLVHLHQSQLVIRDLRPTHVLIGHDHAVRLTHLGVMRSLGGYSTEVAEDNTYYSAPEILCRVINTSSDMWSLGVLMIFLLQTQTERMSTPLFHGHDSHSLLDSMIKVVGRPFTKGVEEMATQCQMDEDGTSLLGYATQLPVPFEDMIDVLRKKVSRADKSTLDLLSHLLQFLPHHRITAPDALNHSFFKDQDQSKDDNDDPYLNSTTSTTSTTSTSIPSTPPTPIGSDTNTIINDNNTTIKNNNNIDNDNTPFLSNNDNDNDNININDNPFLSNDDNNDNNPFLLSSNSTPPIQDDDVEDDE